MTKRTVDGEVGFGGWRVAALAAAGLGMWGCGDDSTSGPDGGDADVADGGDGEAADAACPVDVPGGHGIAVTEFGAVQGADSEGGGLEFLGVPYARPPVGELRWRAPQDPDCWEGARPAIEWGEACLQRSYDITASPPTMEDLGSEDCLSLNVWTPDIDDAARPVLVFIHGGGNQQGSARDEAMGALMYEGRFLSQTEDVVVVSIQYRLGLFGFLADPSLEDADGHAGNYGLLDQTHALRWVRRNIEAFGGDPERVLVFGQSAGGLDVCMLVASPLAAGLFDAALIQSGGCIVLTEAEAQARSEEWATAVGCADAAGRATCLRALDGAALLGPIESPELDGITNLKFIPYVDGWVLPSAPVESFRAGTHNHVPVIIGTNSDEVSLMVPEGSVTPAEVTAFFERFADPLPARLAELYPPGTTPESARAAYIQALGDGQFTCQARMISRALVEGQTEPVRRYYFTHRVPGDLGASLGAFHGIENFYLFRTAESTLLAVLLTDDDRLVEDALGGWWTRFAATGDPNGTGGPSWPVYETATDPYLEIAPEAVTGAGLHTEACDLWEPISEIPTE
ncbi:MAG: carboxylesterase family protein [Deltaproteobacteria bacterium]|nr:carboxylesterase family protein [Deltaproteobacteria bacterium]